MLLTTAHHDVKFNALLFQFFNSLLGLHDLFFQSDNVFEEKESEIRKESDKCLPKFSLFLICSIFSSLSVVIDKIAS